MADLEPALAGLAHASGNVDRVEEEHALAAVEAALFERKFQPVRMGRYVLLERLGAGAGGVVYRGYDPELHRRVAIKLLRATRRSASSRKRLLREAQALARLSHPHVVAVYDVGVITGGGQGREGVFIVMEYTDGTTLDRWLRATRRSWSDVVDVMIEAGRGLAAVHRHGLVHRDFKPANVMLQAAGGAKVVDFGLAGSTPTTSSSRSIGDDPEMLDYEEELGPLLLSLPSGATHDIVGTPPYMAPEQHAGGPIDVRADVYAFCATMFEALYGRLPFGTGSLDALLRTKRDGPPAPPSDRRIPRWLADVVARGLQPDPDARFSDMDALLARLERGRGANRRRALLGGSVLSFGAFAALAWPTSEDCSAQARLEGVWDEQVRAAAHEAFVTDGAPHGSEIWPQLSAHLDEYAGSWVKEREAACSSDASVDERGAQALCLQQELDRFARVTRAFASADVGVIRNSMVMALQLEPPSSCREASSALRGQAGHRRGSNEQTFGRDRRLLQAEVLHQSGKYAPALELTEHVFAEAEDVDDPPGAARAAMLACASYSLSNRFQDAEWWCQRAIQPAERSQNDALVVDALVGWAGTITNLKRFDEADRLLQVADARLEVVDPPQLRQRRRADVLRALGHLRGAQYREHEAIPPLREALEIFEQTYGRMHPEVLGALNGLAMNFAGREQYQSALVHYERALEVARHLYGRRHPMVAALENNIAGTYLDLGRLDDAREHIELSLEIKEETLGPDSPRLVTSLARLGRVLVALDLPEEGLRHLQRALDLQRAESGLSAPATAEGHVGLAVALTSLGRCDEALRHLDDAAAILRRFPRALPQLAWSVPLERHHCEVALGLDDAAKASLHEALESLRSRREEQPTRLATTLRDLARWHIAHEDPERAVELLQEAILVVSTRRSDPRIRASIEFELARLTYRSAPDQAMRSAALAAQRLDPLPWAQSERAEIQAWLNNPI